MEIKKLAVFFVVGCMAQGAAAQSFKVIGTIIDKRGVPIPNASVVMPGEPKGTSTDSLGNFSLNIHPGCQLTISAVGFEAETVDIDQENKLAIVLKSDMRTTSSANTKSSPVTGDPTGSVLAKQVQDNF